jgi:hypothetical protein
LVKGRADAWCLFADAFTFANNGYRRSKAFIVLLPCSVFDQVMKNIFFCFSIALIILLPASVAAINCTAAGEVKMTHAKRSVIKGQLNKGAHLFDDVLIDIPADDDLDESGRRKTFFVKASVNATLFTALDFYSSCDNNIFADTSFVPLQTSLFIFISQFRL